MNEQILLPMSDTPARKFWKPWRWIGLAVFVVVLVFRRWVPGLILVAGYFYGIIVLGSLLFFSFRYLRERFFWRVRNRLIGSFIFVGLIPLLILLGAVFVTSQLLLRQLAMNYLHDSLEENKRLVTGIGEELGRKTGPSGSPDSYQAHARRIFSEHTEKFPMLASRLLRRHVDGTFEIVSKLDPGSILQEDSPHPGDRWLGEKSSFEGILSDKENVFISSLQPVSGSSDLYIEMAAPLDDHFEQRLLKEKSLTVAFLFSGGINISYNGQNVSIETPGSGKDRKPEDLENAVNRWKATEKTPAAERAAEKIQRFRKAESADSKSGAGNLLQWFMPLKCRQYQTGKDDFGEIAFFYVPQAVILRAYLGGEDSQVRFFLIIIYILVAMFVFVELVSLTIGFSISRHITRSVHDVYQGILALQKGNLDYKIPVRRKDQLGLLANAFNQMSASIARLLEEVGEKKRLEQELQIAREVQATLFPKQLPNPPGLSIFGGCKPARIVSGDYYDFILEDETRLNMVVGDICGKGISAALLMSSLQASVHAQLPLTRYGHADSIEQSLAGVMEQLNRQLYMNSPSEKFASLFLSQYDSATRRLWYCNAGHPRPILFSADGTRFLGTTGTVVGMFPDAVYHVESVELAPGSSLAIFSDGVTEAVNKADEEFGLDQLLETLRQSINFSPDAIWNAVVAKIDEWQGGLPQSDDITLIIAKVE